MGVWVLIPYFLLNIMKRSSPAFSRNKRQRKSAGTHGLQISEPSIKLHSPDLQSLTLIASGFFGDEDNVGRVEEIEILAVHVLYN